MSDPVMGERYLFPTCVARMRIKNMHRMARLGCALPAIDRATWARWADPVAWAEAEAGGWSDTNAARGRHPVEQLERLEEMA